MLPFPQPLVNTKSWLAIVNPGNYPIAASQKRGGEPRAKPVVMVASSAQIRAAQKDCLNDRWNTSRNLDGQREKSAAVAVSFLERNRTGRIGRGPALSPSRAICWSTRSPRREKPPPAENRGVRTCRCARVVRDACLLPRFGPAPSRQSGLQSGSRPDDER